MSLTSDNIEASIGWCSSVMRNGTNLAYDWLSVAWLKIDADPTAANLHRYLTDNHIDPEEFFVMTAFFIGDSEECDGDKEYTYAKLLPVYHAYRMQASEAERAPG